MWGQTWGQLVWGQTASVPSLGGWGTLVLGVLLGMTAVLALRRVGARAAGVLVLAVALIVPIAARALPFTFANGTIADADQVNANFAAVNVTTSRISLPMEQTFAKLQGPAFLFVGSTVNIATTATQRMTGAVTSSFFLEGTGGTLYDALCYRPSGTTQALVSFAGGHSENARSLLASSASGTTTVTDTVVPGAGTWEVGRCLVNQANSILHVTVMTGWVQVTPQ
jgi:hypothetical protein